MSTTHDVQVKIEDCCLNRAVTMSDRVKVEPSSADTSGSAEDSHVGCTEHEVKGLCLGEPPPHDHDYSEVLYETEIHYIAKAHEDNSNDENTLEVTTSTQNVTLSQSRMKKKKSAPMASSAPKKVRQIKKDPSRVMRDVPMVHLTESQAQEVMRQTMDVPTPSLFLECEMTDSDIMLDFPKTEAQSNLGSESESEDENEDITVCTVPRSFRAAIDQPEDDVWEYIIPADTDPGLSLKASQLIDFEWTELPNPPIPFDSRRETFSERHGPVIPFLDPYTAFTTIWSKQFMEHIATETNRYAQQLAQQMIANNTLQPGSRICDWTDTTVDELYVYLAVVLAMGVVVKSRIEDYWMVSRDIFQTPGFRVIMTLRRFQLLSRCLHFNNNQDMRELDSAAAKLFKIRPVIQHLNAKFQTLYKLGRNIVMDESLLQRNSWSDVQSVPNKGVGIKTYEICEPQTGYLWRFEVHAHKRTDPDRYTDQQMSTSALVLRLLKGLEHRGHTLWMDNSYNSLALARGLKSLGFDCVGTLSTNRQHLPSELAALVDNDMWAGLAGVTSGDIDILVWKEKNSIVATISTYHGCSMTNDGSEQKPTAVVDYKTVMRGICSKDQLLASYPIERKRTRIWYKKLFRRLLNVSVLNAHILCKRKPAHIRFRMDLINSLLEKHGLMNTSDEPRVLSRNVVSAVIAKHHLTEYPYLPTQQYGRLRRICQVCKKRVTTYCLGCEKTLCMTPCFVAFHTSLSNFK